MMTSLALPERRVFMVEVAPRVTLPDFITKASLELIWTRNVNIHSYGHLPQIAGSFDKIIRRKIDSRCRNPSWTSWGPSLRVKVFTDFESEIYNRD